MDKRFSCAKCGKCCNNNLIEGKAGAIQTEGKKGPLYTSTAMGLPVLDFQKIEMEEEAKKLGIKASFVPEKFCFDALTKTKVVATWKLEGAPCPFLSEENRCKIYSKRPFICRRFPLLVKDKNRIVCSSSCQAVSSDDLKQLGSREDFDKFFSKQLEVLKKGKEGIKQINNILGRLPAAGKVFYVTEMAQKELFEKFPKHKTQGLFEFMESNKIGNKNLSIEIKKAMKNA